MLPHQLLRFKVTNKGKNIAPLLCDFSNPNFNLYVHLADKMISELNQSLLVKEKKGELIKKISLLESVYDDYKLVRGLYTLLERRCTFDDINIFSKFNNTGDLCKVNNQSADHAQVFNKKYLSPSEIRKMLYELSSERGYSLTSIDRTEIFNVVAAKTGIPPDIVSLLMWSDLEENLVLERFEPITAENLIAWYNLSLIQTLMFNCIKIEFSLTGGTNWKYALRAVKRLGLMYALEYRSHPAVKGEDENVFRSMQDGNGSMKSEFKDSIICSIDGPLSLFKLTDRYGAAIAKLVPIIISLPSWSLKAWIVRKTFASNKKIYEFEMSESSSCKLAEPSMSSIESTYAQNSGNDYFDSNLERNFASRFIQSIHDWKMTREPDPLILPNGKAMIPDFLFEKYERRVYLEIVGFWTKEYLFRKVQKLETIINSANANQRNKIDLLIAIDEGVYASAKASSIERDAWRSLISTISDKRVILYNNQNIPLKPVLVYLKTIDEENTKNLIESGFEDILDKILDSLDNNYEEVISITDLANKWNVQLEFLLKVLQSQAENRNRIDNYALVDKYLISDFKLEKLKSLLKSIDNLNEANDVLKFNGIPESCILDVISKLGFEIVWYGIDSSRASIKRNV
ncbi:MAG TPA: DUF790 family protein [Nitrososphaeraceae archaeon]